MDIIPPAIIIGEVYTMALVSRKKVLGFPKRQDILKGVRERYKYSRCYRGISNYAVEVVPLSYEGLTDIGAGLKGFC